MRRDKTVARVLLIFSIASVVLAAPALVRQRRLVTDRADDEPTDESEQAHGLLAEPVHHGVLRRPPQSGRRTGRSCRCPTPCSTGWTDLGVRHPSHRCTQIIMLEPPSGLLHQDLVPVSGASESHSDVPLVSGGPGLHGVPFPWWLHTAERPPAQFEVGESSSHMESGAPGGREGTGGLAPASGAQPLHDLNPVTDIEQAATSPMGPRGRPTTCISTGLLNEVQKETMGTVSPGRTFLLPSLHLPPSKPSHKHSDL
jgi:hypothetical protein